jgi:hypothetical protein
VGTIGRVHLRWVALYHVDVRARELGEEAVVGDEAAEERARDGYLLVAVTRLGDWLMLVRLSPIMPFLALTLPCRFRSEATWRVLECPCVELPLRASN